MASHLILFVVDREEQRIVRVRVRVAQRLSFRVYDQRRRMAP